MTYSTAALVGATGGAGTTRLAVELGGTLARDGREVVILDAAFATEGLARHLSGRVEPDLTTLLTDDAEEQGRPPTEQQGRPPTEQQGRPLTEGLHEHSATADLEGRLALCPAHAPFERLARAKTADAAQRFEELVDQAAREFDHAIVDTPPVAANQAVAAVSSADRVAVVAPASERGVDAVQRTRGRIADVGASVDAVVANRVTGDRTTGGHDPDEDEEDHPLRSADTAVPESDATGVETVPTSALDPEPGFAPAVAHLAEVVLDAELELEFEEAGLFDLDANVLPDALS